MIAGLAPGEDRTFARSILAARREGRKLQPISNTRLFSTNDAESVYQAIIDLRETSGEKIQISTLTDDGETILMTNAQLVESAPSILVDGRVAPVIAYDSSSGKDRRYLGFIILDRLFERSIREDQIASGHGRVSLILGPEILFNGEATLRMGRERAVIKNLTAIPIATTNIEGVHIRTTAPLLMAQTWERGGVVVADLIGPEKLSFTARRL